MSWDDDLKEENFGIKSSLMGCQIEAEHLEPVKKNHINFT
jgi:hypothetical protein